MSDDHSGRGKRDRLRVAVEYGRERYEEQTSLFRDLDVKGSGLVTVSGAVIGLLVANGFLSYPVQCIEAIGFLLLSGALLMGLATVWPRDVKSVADPERLRGLAYDEDEDEVSLLEEVAAQYAQAWASHHAVNRRKAVFIEIGQVLLVAGFLVSVIAWAIQLG